MTKDDICRWIHMAWDFTNQSEENLKQKFQYLEAHYLPYEKFAKLVAEHEREACAKLCDELSDKDGFEGCYADACAEAIRARNT
jgi:hypothetical protein